MSQNKPKKPSEIIKNNAMKMRVRHNADPRNMFSGGMAASEALFLSILEFLDQQHEHE